MCLAAYPGGLKEIQQSKRWAVVLGKFAKETKNATESEVAAAISEFLRAEHANRAQDLPNVEWKTSDEVSYRLIEKVEIRQKFGQWIGEVAASHWWSHDKLAQELDRIVPAPPPFSTTWNIDLLKVASILRVADAAHIDERRAPGFVRALRASELDSTSTLHWLFQSRLTQPERRSDALYYSSTSDFQSSEIEAWWLAYDTLRMINDELRGIDVLLADLRGDGFRFSARRVANVESASTMINSIRVAGWIPVDTAIKITDIPRLIGSLGGEALYGERPTVPLRELVQNAADAVRLKAAVLPNFDIRSGLIGISIGQDDQGFYLCVTDNGVGMTKEILTGPFLDFGNSGWSKDPAFTDFPDAAPSQLQMIGKFGIGFFATFMLGEKVDVVTRRFDKGFQDTLVLSFFGGASRRPILRPATQSEWLIEGGTSIKVWLKSPPESIDQFFGEHEAPLKVICDRQFPTIDVKLKVNDGRADFSLAPVDWKNINAKELIEKINGINELPHQYIPFCKNMRPILGEGGEIHGRMFVAPRSHEVRIENLNIRGSLVSRGIEAGRVDGLFGVMNADINVASRLHSRPSVPKRALREWIHKQAELLSKMNLPISHQADCAETIRSLGGNISELKFCRVGKRWLSTSEVSEFINENDELIILNEYYLRSLDDMNPDANVEPNVIGVDPSQAMIFESEMWMYDDAADIFRDKGEEGSLEEIITKIIVANWRPKPAVREAILNGTINGRRIRQYAEIVIARTREGKEIQSPAKKYWRSMTSRDFMREGN